METPSSEIVTGRDRPTGRVLRLGKRAGLTLVATGLVCWGMGGPWNRPIQAQQQVRGETTGGFSKFGKMYINLSLVTHVIDDPGSNLPPGTMQVYFSGGNAQNFINLYGDDAEALRQALDQGSSGEAPAAKAGAAPKPTAPAPGKAVKRKPRPTGGGDPGE